VHNCLLVQAKVNTVRTRMEEEGIEISIVASPDDADVVIGGDGLSKPSGRSVSVKNSTSADAGAAGVANAEPRDVNAGDAATEGGLDKPEGRRPDVAVEANDDDASSVYTVIARHFSNKRLLVATTLLVVGAVALSVGLVAKQRNDDQTSMMSSAAGAIDQSSITAYDNLPYCFELEGYEEIHPLFSGVSNREFDNTGTGVYEDVEDLNLVDDDDVHFMIIRDDDEMDSNFNPKDRYTNYDDDEAMRRELRGNADVNSHKWRIKDAVPSEGKSNTERVCAIYICLVCLRCRQVMVLKPPSSHVTCVTCRDWWTAKVERAVLAKPGRVPRQEQWDPQPVQLQTRYDLLFSQTCDNSTG
jgi:hypothetical protein